MVTPKTYPHLRPGGIGGALDLSHKGIWEAMWCALRDLEIRQSSLELQADVKDAANLCLLRVPDILLWVSVKSRIDP